MYAATHVCVHICACVCVVYISRIYVSFRSSRERWAQMACTLQTWQTQHTPHTQRTAMGTCTQTDTPPPHPQSTAQPLETEQAETQMGSEPQPDVLTYAATQVFLETRKMAISGVLEARIKYLQPSSVKYSEMWSRNISDT